jgi:hypothetical protein
MPVKAACAHSKMDFFKRLACTDANCEVGNSHLIEIKEENIDVKVHVQLSSI